MAGAKAIVRMGRNLPKSAFGRGRIKRRNIDQMYFTRTESFSTAKDLGDVKARLEMVQYQDEICLLYTSDAADDLQPV